MEEHKLFIFYGQREIGAFFTEYKRCLVSAVDLTHALSTFNNRAGGPDGYSWTAKQLEISPNTVCEL